MIRSYIFNQDIEKKYIENFNNYVLDILYGGNVLIGSDIENEWKDVSADGEEWEHIISKKNKWKWLI